MLVAAQSHGSCGERLFVMRFSGLGVLRKVRRIGVLQKRFAVGTFVTYALKHHSLNPTFPTEALDSSVRAELVKLFCFFLRS